MLYRTDGCGRSYAGFDAFPTYFIYGGLVFAVRPAAPLAIDSSVIWGRVTLPLWPTVLGPSQPLVYAAYPLGNSVARYTYICGLRWRAPFFQPLSFPLFVELSRGVSNMIVGSVVVERAFYR
jgi:hypothetical protein